jgi:ATP-binding cassette subfamily F protein 2
VPPILEIKNLNKTYNTGFKALDGINLEIQEGEIFAILGPNGAGKSTLLKLMVGENQATEGMIQLRSGMSIGRYHQHSAEVLDLEKTPLQYIESKYHDRYPERKPEDWRSCIGQFGLNSEFHELKIKYLSEGLKTKLIFCDISLQKPHILLMDEPTNAADMGLIDSMAEAIKNFNGGQTTIDRVSKRICELESRRSLECDSTHLANKFARDWSRILRLKLCLVIILFTKHGPRNVVNPSITCLIRS